MRARILIVFFVGAVMAGSCCAAPATTDPQADSARSFVQAFYDWYVKTDMDSDSPLKKKPAYFSTELTQALQADEAAAAKSPDEVESLDFDPFLNAQDVCSPYRTGAVQKVGAAYQVEVFGSCADDNAGRPDVIARLIQHGTAWMFVDFIYPARDGQPQDDLLSVLKALQQAREKTPQ